MERLEPTRGHALKVWWAFVWRSMLCAAVPAAATGVAVGFLDAAFPQLDAATLRGGLFLFIAFPIGLAASVEAVYRVLRKRFKGFEIALLRTED